ncbi:MAG TPA: hypothetical protein DCS63_09200 [Elusimicrobia bacterium]|nr:hypothetical protein [Elusimicrobiota bacterium]
MKNIIFALCLVFMPGQICVAGVPAALDALKASVGVTALSDSALQIKPKQNPSSTLTWDVPQILLDYNKDWAFEFKGKQYTVKLDFKQGAYDPYVKSYKARPILSINDVTGMDEFGIISASQFIYLDELAGDGIMMIYLDETSNLTLLRYGNSILLQACNPETGTCEDINKRTIGELYAFWELAAKEFPVTIGGRKLYMVPQDFLDGGFRSGYVVTEKSPLYYTTGQPQDYVELFRTGEDWNLQFRPKAYSLALGLTFELTGSVYPYTWTVREILDSEVQEAINESLANRGRGAAPNPVPGLKKINVTSPVIKAGK